MRHGRVLGATVAVAVVAGLTAGCLADRVQHRHGDTPSASTDACYEAWAHQQDATRFTAATDAAKRLGTFQSWLPVGTLPDALCLETDTEWNDVDWRISSIVLTATGRGDGGLPVTFTRTSTPQDEERPLYIPLRGCVHVEGTITASRRDAPRGKPRTATWTAAGTYGRGCPSAPNKGAYQGDDGMLASR